MVERKPEATAGRWLKEQGVDPHNNGSRHHLEVDKGTAGPNFNSTLVAREGYRGLAEPRVKQALVDGNKQVAEALLRFLARVSGATKRDIWLVRVQTHKFGTVNPPNTISDGTAKMERSLHTYI